MTAEIEIGLPLPMISLVDKDFENLATKWRLSLSAPKAAIVSSTKRSISGKNLLQEPTYIRRSSTNKDVRCTSLRSQPDMSLEKRNLSFWIYQPTDSPSKW